MSGIIDQSAYNVVGRGTEYEVRKVDQDLGLVFGWGIICKIKGQDYFDLHGDTIPEDVMLKSTTVFMIECRMAGDMHVEMNKGTIVHSFPLTTDIAAAMGIQTEQTGWMIAMRPSDPEILQKFADGTYKGFSIGGSATYEMAA